MQAGRLIFFHEMRNKAIKLGMRKRDEVLKALVERRMCVIALKEGEIELTQISHALSS